MQFNIKEQYFRFREWQMKGKQYNPLTPALLSETVCKNCGHTFRGHYCPNCGQSAKVKRLRFFGAFIDFLPNVLELDTKFIRSFAELLTRPGHMIRDYIIDCKRNRYCAPISLLFILAAVYLVVKQILFDDITDVEQERTFAQGITDGLTDSEEHTTRIIEHLPPYLEKVKNLFLYFYDNIAWYTLMTTLLMVLPNKLVFNWTDLGRKMNLTEHFYLAVYTACLNLMLKIIYMPYAWLQGENDADFHSVINFVVTWIVVTQFFQIKKRRSLRLTITSLLLTLLLLILIISLFLFLIIYIFGTDSSNSVLSTAFEF